MPGFDGYPAGSIRIGSLAVLPVEELRELVVGAWPAQAPKRVAKAWLAAQDE